MQGPYGSTEAAAINGTEISPLTTWDSKITTVLGMLGGVSDLVGQALAGMPGDVRAFAGRSWRFHDAAAMAAAGPGRSAYDRFMEVVAREHERVFGGPWGLAGVGTPFAVPTVDIPAVLPDWPTCQRGSPTRPTRVPLSDTVSATRQ